MKIDIITIFPNFFDSFLNTSIIKRAIEQQLVSIPMINSVKDMYTFILSHEIEILSREDESPSEYMTRVKAINRLNFQISKTEKAIIYETQPKKKFEYNERLRRYKRELDELMRMER